MNESEKIQKLIEQNKELLDELTKSVENERKILSYYDEVCVMYNQRIKEIRFLNKELAFAKKEIQVKQESFDILNAAFKKLKTLFRKFIIRHEEMTNNNR